jgi:hypothetical protein
MTWASDSSIKPATLWSELLERYFVQDEKYSLTMATSRLIIVISFLSITSITQLQ